MIEAIHTETPIVAVPFSVDQPPNAQFLCRAGAAVHLPILTATKKEISDALAVVVKDKR